MRARALRKSVAATPARAPSRRVSAAVSTPVPERSSQVQWSPAAALLDEDSPMPRWAQIAQILRQRIAEHRPGLTSLTDQSLAREFGVSPLTVRQALNDLVRSGLVTRHRGKGTFVAAKPVQGSVDHLEALMSEWRIEGRDVRIE